MKRKGMVTKRLEERWNRKERKWKGTEL